MKGFKPKAKLLVLSLDVDDMAFPPGLWARACGRGGRRSMSRRGRKDSRQLRSLLGNGSNLFRFTGSVKTNPGLSTSERDT